MKKCNYHTHTNRCGHAYGSDEEFVIEAINGGYKVLGFADHTPWNYKSNYRSPMRMELKEFEDYYQSLKALKEKYADQIQILIGLEAEYFPEYMDWLLKFKEEYQLDYLIFGNHFDTSDEYGPYFGRWCIEDEHLERYVQTSIEGMQSGHFLYFAHPDLYMRNRFSFEEKEKEAAYRICKAAKELNIPLEYNLEGLVGKKYDEKAVGYPCLEFWKIAKEVGNQVIIGVDAHKPSAFSSQSYHKIAYQTLKDLGFEIIHGLKIDTD